MELGLCAYRGKIVRHRDLFTGEGKARRAEHLVTRLATAHFDGGPTTQTAVLWRQEVPVTRLLMTFLETRELNVRFREAEAVLIADPDNHAF